MDGSGQSQFADTKFLAELMAEKDSIDPSFVHAVQLLSKRISEAKNPNERRNETSKSKQFFDMTEERLPKVECNMKLPTDKFPNFNFIGKILGPGGSTLQAIQDLTTTRIAILGKGSVRDKKKVEEHIASKDPKWDHLNLPLHVRISSIARLDQAYINIGNACTEIVKVIQADLEEFGVNEKSKGMGVQRGRGRGSSSNGRGMARGGRGGRGGPSQQQRDVGRGGNRGVSRGGGRGVSAASRGNRGFRGGIGATRGNSRGAMRGASQSHFNAPAVVDPYASQGYDHGQGELYAESFAEYGDQQTYDAYEGYVDPYGEGYVDASFDYAYGESYDAYGNGAQQPQPPAQYGLGKPFRGKMMPGRGSTMRGRGSNPY